MVSGLLRSGWNFQRRQQLTQKYHGCFHEESHEDPPNAICFYSYLVSVPLTRRWKLWNLPFVAGRDCIGVC